MKTKISKIETAMIQSVRLFPSEPKFGDSLNDFLNVACDNRYAIFDVGGNRRVFSCAIPDYDFDYSEFMQDLGKGRDVELNQITDFHLSYVQDVIGREWVFTSGIYQGKGFDLSDDDDNKVKFGRSHIIVGNALNQLLSEFNKSTDGIVWIRGDNRATFKKATEFSYLLVDCEVQTTKQPFSGVAVITRVKLYFKDGECGMQIEQVDVAQLQGYLTLQQAIETNDLSKIFAAYREEKARGDNSKSHNPQVKDEPSH